MSIKPLPQSALIARDLLEVIEPLIAAYKDERQFLAAVTGACMSRQELHGELARMDGIIARAEAVVRRARQGLAA